MTSEGRPRRNPAPEWRCPPPQPECWLPVALTPTGALAEDRVAWGQKIWQDKAGCNYCHGWAGDGVGGFHHPGHAPSLRATELTRDQIRETIQCGRPGTSMPHFDRFAYTDKRCYDMTAADLGDQKPNRAGHDLQARRNRRARRLRGDKDQGLGQGYPRAMPNYYGPGGDGARITLRSANERHPFRRPRNSARNKRPPEGAAAELSACGLR